MYLYQTELDDNGTWLITCPKLPEVTTFAEGRGEIRKRATDAIEEAIAARIADGRDLPESDEHLAGTFADLPLLTEFKVDLYRALKAAGITRAELVRRLGGHREQVDRLFRLDHASKLDQIQDAFAALDLRIDYKVRSVSRPEPVPAAAIAQAAPEAHP